MIAREPEGSSFAEAEKLVLQARGRLDDLLACEGLRHLVLDDSLWLDQASIARLTGLRTLSMIGVTVSDFDFLAPLVDLEDLRISRLPAAGVDEFGKLPDLRSLELLGADPLPSLDFVTRLERLETLRADRVSDPDQALHALSGHPSLHTLVIPDPELRDLQALAGTRLRTFETWNNRVSDLGPLAGQQALERLYLQDTQVSDLGPLSNLPSLREVWLHGCSVRDLTHLASCPALRLLGLQTTSEVVWEGLAALIHLEVLYLQFSEIANLEPLSELRRLRVLDLRNTEIHSVKPLAELENLEDVVIAGTAVRDPSPLAGLPRLRRIVIDSEQEESASRAGLTAEVG